MCRQSSALSLQESWLERLAFDANPNTAKLIQLWLGIFPVNWRQLPTISLLARQIKAIESVLQRSYTDLLQAMLADPALQLSLNGPSNHRGNPNENFARELLELFSLGEGNFSERDVIEAARALTGYQISPLGHCIQVERRHDSGPKTILGRTENFDGRSLVDWLCRQPTTAQTLTSRLWQQQIGPLPPQAKIVELAQAWRSQRLSLPWIFEALHASPEAQYSRRRGLKLLDPIQMVARSLCLLGSRHPAAFTIARNQLVRMGQSPFEPPSVKGWPVNAQWINLRWLQARRRGLLALISDEEVWVSRVIPAQLSSSLTPIPPLSLRLPAPSTRENVALLFADPVWQLAGNP
jgi:uncharacterized protein (DUF1800 family)